MLSYIKKPLFYYDLAGNPQDFMVPPWQVYVRLKRALQIDNLSFFVPQNISGLPRQRRLFFMLFNFIS